MIVFKRIGRAPSDVSSNVLRCRYKTPASSSGSASRCRSAGRAAVHALRPARTSPVPQAHKPLGRRLPHRRDGAVRDMKVTIGEETKSGRKTGLIGIAPKDQRIPTGRTLEDMLTLQKLSLIHISEPTRQAEISYAVFCLKKK